VFTGVLARAEIVEEAASLPGVPAARGWGVLEWGRPESTDRTGTTGMFKKAPDAVDAQQALQQEATQQHEAAKQQAEDAKRLADQQFWASPVGRARAAHQRGWPLFEISLPVMSNDGTANQGNSVTYSNSYDNSEMLAAITAEGWQLHTMSTAFVTTNTVTSDKWSGMARSEGVSGFVLATYVFKRFVEMPV
jgi:hypothetical protein